MERNLITVENVRGYVGENGVAYLNLEDVARGLGWTRDKGKYVRWERIEPHFVKFNNVPQVGQRPEYIEEGDFYMLAMIAESDLARQFQKKVCYEILPSIRKNGIYATDITIEKMISNPDFAIGLLTKLKEEREEKKKLELITKQQQLKIEQDKPKVEYHDTVLNTETCYTTTQIAKELEMSARQLNVLLYHMGVQFKQSGQWLLTAKYQDKGYVRTRTYLFKDKDGKEKTKHSTVWTEKGREFLIDLSEDF